MKKTTDVAKKAMELVKKYEKKEGRQPKEVKNKGYDLKSGSYQIEVKGRQRPSHKTIELCENNIRACEKEPNYRLYIVGNPFKDPTLIIMNAEEVIKRPNKKEQRVWKFSLIKEDDKKKIFLKRKK